MATTVTIAIMIGLNLVTIGLLMRCGAKGWPRDTAADREANQAIRESNLVIAKHSNLQYQGNERLAKELSLVNRNLELMIELEQAKHIANFVNIDSGEKSA